MRWCRLQRRHGGEHQGQHGERRGHDGHNKGLKAEAWGRSRRSAGSGSSFITHLQRRTRRTIRRVQLDIRNAEPEPDNRAVGAVVARAGAGLRPLDQLFEFVPLVTLLATA